MPEGPALVAHADWGTQPDKQWLAIARLDGAGVYRVDGPSAAEDPANLLQRLFSASGKRSTLVGFDFPIGVPATYAELAGIEHFLSVLPAFGWREWADFYRVAVTPEEISLRRPFYPFRPGGTSTAHLYGALGVDGMEKLLRRCDHATADRRAACSIFWTLGGNQVGKGAISGWRDVLGPALRERALPISIWPFDGRLNELLAEPQVVVAETYPAEFYRHLAITLKGSKREQSVRLGASAQLFSWLEREGVAGRVRFEPSAVQAVESAFGARKDGEDRFDAFIGLIGMLNIVLGARPAGEPADDSPQRRVEGWILGQDPTKNPAQGELSLTSERRA